MTDEKETTMRDEPQEHRGDEEERVVLRHHFALSHLPFSLPIHDDARLVHVGRKPGDPSASANVWEMHRVDIIRAAVVPRRWFVVRGTGDMVSGHARHVATWSEGQFYIWHLFEVDKPEPQP